jgi:hypothetical protein
MQLLPSDPDIETIVSRIRSGVINLQPDFQRGEVWGKPKKQRLIDSILRNWHVPPIHVIENSKSGKQEVLDGQQRLVSIRDFVAGAFPVDGETEPLDIKIQALDGKYYAELPEEWQRRFNQFPIRVFRIVDYQASEPAELFFRLNQPASLTGAEQRNAFFGPVRQQIRSLVENLERLASRGRPLAFSNSRMAYDDVLARTALAVQRRTLAEKITSEDLDELYRQDRPLASETIQLVGGAIEALAAGIGNEQTLLPKFNKATLFSWLIFLARGVLVGNPLRSGKTLEDFLSFFEEMRIGASIDPRLSKHRLGGLAPTDRLFSIYENRSSARVADISSVVLRDAIIWLAFDDFALTKRSNTISPPTVSAKLRSVFQSNKTILEADILARRLIENGWGALE